VKRRLHELHTRRRRVPSGDSRVSVTFELEAQNGHCTPRSYPPSAGEASFVESVPRQRYAATTLGAPPVSEKR
jgi:hypothetical protein